MLGEIPTDILRSYIFSVLDGQSLINLSLVSKHFYYIINNDEFIWRRLCADEFNISLDSAFRNTGWKKFYEALKFHTQVFVWGENRDRRLGLVEPEDLNTAHSSPMFRPIFRGRPMPIRGTPMEVTTPYELTPLSNKSIIDISVGGWSFHALDTSGSVWTWGSFQRDIIPSSSIGTRLLREPTLLQSESDIIPKIAFKSISSGRAHVIGLARDGSVWHWSNHIILQKVELHSDSKVAQVVANWSYSSVLTEDGSIYIVPKPDLVAAANIHTQPPSTEIAATTGLKASDFGLSEDKVIQIAGLDNYTIALTRFGRVLKLSTSDPVAFANSPLNCVTELVHFSSEENELNDRHRIMKRFITGSFNNFAVYTQDKVMLGNKDAVKETEPQRIPELDNQAICKVSFGDYHYGALTNQGRVLTWGKYSSGALGQGKVSRDEEHAPKYVETLNEKFVFTIGFGGWQSSALAVDKMFTSSDST